MPLHPWSLQTLPTLPKEETAPQISQPLPSPGSLRTPAETQTSFRLPQDLLPSPVRVWLHRLALPPARRLRGLRATPERERRGAPPARGPGDRGGGPACPCLRR